MPQIFHPSFNTIARASIFGAVFIIAGAGWVAWEVERSPYVTREGMIPDQPVPFSHEHHVSGLGIDCRYCHTSVEDSPFAGLPPTKTCMTCHSQIWTNAELLRPVRESWRTSRPIRWTRVHNLPHYAYFHHDIHVNKGIGCATCHGAVNQMPMMWQNASLQMEWCLNCHRDPAKYLRPRDQIYNMQYDAKSDPNSPGGEELMSRYHILPKRQMQSCSTCHR